MVWKSFINLHQYHFLIKFLEAESEFFLEFPDEQVERFKNPRDVVEFVSRSFFADWIQFIF